MSVSPSLPHLSPEDQRRVREGRGRCWTHTYLWDVDEVRVEFGAVFVLFCFLFLFTSPQCRGLGTAWVGQGGAAPARAVGT